MEYERNGLDVVDSAADTLAVLEATTTVAAPPKREGTGVQAQRAVVFAAFGMAAILASLVVLVLASTGVVSDPEPTGTTWVHWLLAALGVALAALSIKLAVDAARVRDGLAAGLSAGFGIAGSLVALAELMQIPVIGSGRASAGSVALSGAVFAGAVGLASVSVPHTGRLLGFLVRNVWLPVCLIVFPAAAAVAIAVIRPVAAGGRIRAVEVGVGIVASLAGLWALRQCFVDVRSEPTPARLTTGVGIVASMFAAAGLAAGATAGLSGMVTTSLLLVAGGCIVASLVVEYARGRRVWIAMEGIFEWAPPSEVADHLREAAEALVDELEGGLEGTRHSNRMIQNTIGLGRELDLPPGRLRVLGLGAMFHDVGTESIPDEILNKPGSLTKAERKLVQMHPETGYAMAARVHMLWEAALAIRHHHEWVDGSGYPDGLRGDEIPIEARVIAVTDMYEALRTPRPYREALSTEEALVLMRAEVGTHLDPACYEAFVQHLLAENGAVIPFPMA